ncbi:hypothetical protein HK104_002077 [Borealophlyctis nickersoniae]|nr:hypothetical protein HK104_002077 [Borealophlyctis nickersoniae]
MTVTPSPPEYKQSVSSSSDTPTNPPSIAPDALRMRTAATASTNPTHRASSPTKPAVYKWRTKKAYLQAVEYFMTEMIIVYTVFALCIIFSLANLARFNMRQGWVVYLAAAQLVAIPVPCVLIYYSYRAVMENKGGDGTIRAIKWAVILLCLNMQAVLAYVDVNEEPGMNGFSEFLEGFTGFIGFISATVVEGLMSWSKLTWFHSKSWLGVQADVLRELPE